MLQRHENETISSSLYPPEIRLFSKLLSKLFSFENPAHIEFSGIDLKLILVVASCVKLPQ